MKHTRSLVAVTLLASMVSACSGGASTSAVPQTPQSHSAGMTGRRQIFYSRSYLKAHPNLAWGGARTILAHRAGTTSNLIYNGGPVETTPVIDLVFWGISSVNDTTDDPDGLAQYLINYFQAIPGSSWLNTDTQYYQTLGGITQYIGNPSTQYGAAYFDSSLPPQTYTDAQVAAEAVKASGILGYNANANYIVVTPTGYTQSGFATQWCAYHSATTSSSGGLLSYTDLPYTPDAGTSCGEGSVNSPGTLDGASIVGGHEEAETQTDPNASTGWLDSSGQEIGDKCAWINLADITFPNGSTFPVQPLWSNASSSCVMSYGSTPTPTPAPTPTPIPTSTPAPTPTPVPTSTPAPTPTPVPTSTPAPTPTPVPTATPCRNHGKHCR